MPGAKGRKKPFSAKQKKEQLKLKRDKKREEERDEFGRPIKHHEKQKVHSRQNIDSDSGGEGDTTKVSLNQQPAAGKATAYNPNRYRLQFLAESHEEIERRKKIAQKPYETLPEKAMELDLTTMYQPGSVLDMPKRPMWKHDMSKDQLQKREEAYFKSYLDSILETHDPQELSYMELNLETWRQLWRVLEMSDIVLLITDIRHPALHFSPTLYDYVTKVMKKKLILVLNKVDLAPAPLVVAWKNYFQQKFPEIHVVCFTSFPKDRQEKEDMRNEDPGKVLHKRRKKKTYTAIGPKQLLKACENIVPSEVDLSDWHEKMEADMSMTVEDEEEDDDVQHKVEVEAADGSYHGHQAYRNGVLTIGCCGYPNVGKSSLINGLMGRKVVSVSKTPGHTKHFQTIFLTPNVKLCDSPGLVFPSLVPKPLQILAGIYPIAQVREPYTAVMYLAERLPLPQLLKLKHPELEPGLDADSLKWSADDVCYAWAEKCGYLTARAARPDVYRAANSILRLALEGRLCLCMRPPDYTTDKGVSVGLGE